MNIMMPKQIFAPKAQIVATVYCIKCVCLFSCCYSEACNLYPCFLADYSWV